MQGKCFMYRKHNITARKYDFTKQNKHADKNKNP